MSRDSSIPEKLAVMGDGERKLVPSLPRGGPGVLPTRSPPILSGCFLYKSQVFLITKRNSGSWKRLTPENGTAKWCLYLGTKLGQIEEQRTLH